MDAPLARTIDANFNRAREALRVLEDLARFTWDDAVLSAAFKEMRHALRHALDAVGLTPKDLADARDSAGDVGRDVGAPDEYEREDVRAVATANLRRAMEALRVLEEVAKIVSPEASRSFERLRYRVYDLEKRSVAPTARRQALAAMRLYVLLSPEETNKPLTAVAEAALAGGADVLQLRMKQGNACDILTVAREIAALCRERQRLFIMNDRADLAAAAGADGVHLGQDDLPIEAARRILPADTVIGVSTHSLEQARDAERRGADYIGIGPAFSTPIKRERAPLDRGTLDKIVHGVNVPHVVIGGVNQHNVKDLAHIGVRAVAVCRSVIAQEDIPAAAAALRASLSVDPP